MLAESFIGQQQEVVSFPVPEEVRLPALPPRLALHGLKETHEGLFTLHVAAPDLYSDFARLVVAQHASMFREDSGEGGRNLHLEDHPRSGDKVAWGLHATNCLWLSCLGVGKAGVGVHCCHTEIRIHSEMRQVD